MPSLSETGFLDLAPHRLEYRMAGPRPHEAPTLILLHQGLGSVGQWDDLPEKLVAETGCGVFAYSRIGYGFSSPAALPRPLDFMHVEAKEILPRVLDAIDFRRGVLVGHSDGASIAAIYAGSAQDHRVNGLVLMAPHFVVENVTMDAIRAIRHAYDTSELRQRFQRHHADADATVRGWSDVWLNNDVRLWDLRDDLAHIRVPVLIVQGEDDDFGTVRQIEIAREECYCPVDALLMPGVKHVPHREAPEATLKAIVEFAQRALRASEAVEVAR